MAKCFNCGKEFDYEKYYGICPKCSAYNKENLSEEVHEELHSLYDKENPHKEEYTSKTEENQQIYVAKPIVNNGKQEKASGASIVGFVCILLGIIAGIIFLFVYIIGNAIAVTEEVEEDVTVDFYDDVSKIPQNPEIITVNPGEAFSIGMDNPCTVSVESAEVVVKADTIPDFPSTENLVAVKLNYENWNSEDYYLYNKYSASETPYIGYNGVFKECLDEYILEEYEEFLPQMNILDIWEITNDVNGNGVFLVFVPVGVTEFKFYMESRSEKTNDVMEIYSVPLQISGEEL